jgi:hypothetical protein
MYRSERRRGNAEAVRDLRHADVGIRQHRLGLDVVVRESRSTCYYSNIKIAIMFVSHVVPRNAEGRCGFNNEAER